jgi:peptidoglycan hydrolase-like protein with peptidoglycan-binding domain
VTRARTALLLAVGIAACANPKRVREDRTPPPKAEAPDEPGEKGVGAEPGRPQAPAAPEGLLTAGTARELQRALADRGYLEGHRSGELDDATAAALRRFQEEEGLAATGMPDRETLSRLGLDPDAAMGRNEPAAGSDGSRDGAAK